MDVWSAFGGESTMSYGGGSMRHAYYRDYEVFPYGTLEHSTSPNSKDPYSRVQEKCRLIQSERSSKKQCPFCKENKKRPLCNYMRRRESRKHNESICEDEEEEYDEEQEEEHHNAQCGK